MSANVELDLIGVLSPLCLLKCKSVLSAMESGHVLEVLLQDHDVVKELSKIINYSQDAVIKLEKGRDHYRTYIKKA